MGKRLQKIRDKWQAKRQEYLLEIKRQTVHALGVLAIIPLILLSELAAVRVFGALVLLTLLGNWYLTRRRMREKYVQQFIKELGLPRREELTWKRSFKEFGKFEQEVIYTLMKNFKRTQERQPLMASFWFLFSSFMAMVLFGVPFAIFGLLALGIGDAFSTIIGKKWGRLKIIYNKDKSVEGSIAFFATVFASVLVFLHFFPQFAIFNPYLLAGIVAVAGAAIETLPTVNDNASIPIGVSLVLWLILLAL